MAGLGLDAKMIANTDPELKKPVGWLAYVDAIAPVARRHASVLRIRYRARRRRGTRHARAHRSWSATADRCPATSCCCPTPQLDDGVFDIVTLRPEGFVGWAQIWVKIVWENGVLRRSSGRPQAR